MHAFRTYIFLLQRGLTAIADPLVYNCNKNSQNFWALSGIHSPYFQQSNRTTVTDVNSTETLSRPYNVNQQNTSVNSFQY